MRVQDIQTDDLSLQRQYKNYATRKAYGAAWSIVTSNPQLDDKIFDADKINDIANILTEQQNNYWTNVPTYMATIELAYNMLIAEFAMKQAWDIGTEYQRYNFVLYNNLIYMYINAEKSTGNLPTNTTYWLELGLRGEQGAESVGLNLKYAWDSTTAYTPFDAVQYGNALWVARADSTNAIPVEGDYWMKFIDYGEVSIETDINVEPTDKYVGQIWLKKKG